MGEGVEKRKMGEQSEMRADGVELEDPRLEK